MCVCVCVCVSACVREVFASVAMYLHFKVSLIYTRTHHPLLFPEWRGIHGHVFMPVFACPQGRTAQFVTWTLTLRGVNTKTSSCF